MAGKQSRFLIGIFVTAGLVLTVAAIIWVGASHYFQKGSMFVTYFDESVQGLSVDSGVKYRGVNVGSVRDISVAPDNRLIEVVMKIDMKDIDKSKLTSKLKAAGLTGIVYIELDRKDIEDLSMCPQINFPVEYPVIASRPSDAKHILTMLDKIVSQVNTLDIKSFFDELRLIGMGIDQLVSGPKMQNIVANIESASGHLKQTLAHLDKLTADGGMDNVLKETNAAVADARLLINQIKSEIERMQLVEASERTNLVVAGVQKSVREISHDLKKTADNLQRASDNLEILIDKLKDDPSELLFSRPPAVPARER